MHVIIIIALCMNRHAHMYGVPFVHVKILMTKTQGLLVFSKSMRVFSEGMRYEGI